MMLERSDASSDQKILAKTDQSPSPEVDGAVRLTALLPNGEVVEADVEKLHDFNTATTWCGMVRSAINAIYDHEEISARSEARRQQAGVSRGDWNRSGKTELLGPDGESIAGTEADPAFQTSVEESQPVREEPAPSAVGGIDGLRRECDALRERIERVDWELDRLAKEKADLLLQETALSTALEIYDGKTANLPTSSGLQESEGGESGRVGADDAAPTDEE